jgi:hypothetical protein
MGYIMPRISGNKFLPEDRVPGYFWTWPAGYFGTGPTGDFRTGFPAIFGHSVPAILGQGLPAILGHGVPAILGQGSRLFWDMAYRLFLGKASRLFLHIAYRLFWDRVPGSGRGFVINVGRLPYGHRGCLLPNWVRRRGLEKEGGWVGFVPWLRGDFVWTKLFTGNDKG